MSDVSKQRDIAVSEEKRAGSPALAAAGITPRVAAELGSNAAVVGEVAAGAGAGISPARTVEARSAVSQLDVRGLTLLRPFVLVTKRDRTLSPAAESFIATCVG